MKIIHIEACIGGLDYSEIVRSELILLQFSNRMLPLNAIVQRTWQSPIEINPLNVALILSLVVAQYQQLILACRNGPGQADPTDGFLVEMRLSEQVKQAVRLRIDKLQV